MGRIKLLQAFLGRKLPIMEKACGHDYKPHLSKRRGIGGRFCDAGLVRQVEGWRTGAAQTQHTGITRALQGSDKLAAHVSIRADDDGYSLIHVKLLCRPVYAGASETDCGRLFAPPAFMLCAHIGLSALQALAANKTERNTP